MAAAKRADGTTLQSDVIRHAVQKLCKWISSFYSLLLFSSPGNCFLFCYCFKTFLRLFDIGLLFAPVFICLLGFSFHLIHWKVIATESNVNSQFENKCNFVIESQRWIWNFFILPVLNIKYKSTQSKYTNITCYYSQTKFYLCVYMRFLLISSFHFHRIDKL